MSYIKIARFDHWIKQLFILPGSMVAMLLLKEKYSIVAMSNVLLSLLATSFIASANYVINEWLDAEFDKFHPVKSKRPLVNNSCKKEFIFLEYFIFIALGVVISLLVSKYVLITELVLLLMGILYNVKPFRMKEIPYVDVLIESINNALRFLIGWFAITSMYYPPVSIVFGYWMSGGYLMSVKRFAEYRMIDDKETASLYRKSFRYYNDNNLMIYSIFLALMAVFFLGIFLIKYKIELLLFMPFMIGLFCFYFAISFKDDSAVQRPEKLYKERNLIFYIIILIIVFVVLMYIRIPFLDAFTTIDLVPIAGI